MTVPDDGPIRITVPPADAGQPVLAIAARALGSEEAARAVLAHGGLWRNRARVSDGQAPVAPGDAVFVHRPPGGAYAVVVFDAGRVLYEDDALLAVDKPAGVYVESTPWDAHGHLRGAVERFLAERSAAAGTSVANVHLAHRLDRDTTGVLLLSRDPAANPALQRAFESGAVHKEYLCICAGEPPEDEFTVSTGHGRARQGLFRVYGAEEVGRALPDGSRVKAMVTRFAVLRRLGGAALLRAFPLTGRTHQIRLHLAHLGHPLLGDARYGGPGVWRGAVIPHQLLHAARLALPHPRTGVPLVITAPVPGEVWWDCVAPVR